MTKFAQLLSLYMEILEISEEELAKYIGVVDRGSIHNWKKGASSRLPPKAKEVLDRIVNYLAKRIEILHIDAEIIQPDLESGLETLKNEFKIDINDQKHTVEIENLSKQYDLSIDKNTYKLMIAINSLKIKVNEFYHNKSPNERENVPKWNNEVLYLRIKAFDTIGNPIKKLLTASGIHDSSIEEIISQTNKYTQSIEFEAAMTEQQIREIVAHAKILFDNPIIRRSKKQYIE